MFISFIVVAILLRMAYDIRIFILILAIVLLGFAEAFWLLSHPTNPNEDTLSDDKFLFGNVEKSLENIFYAMINGFSSSIEFLDLPRLGFALVILFSLIVTILMLNLLIALMTKSFDEVKEHCEAQWRYEQATIMLEEDYRMQSLCPPYVHLLRQKRNLNAASGHLSENQLLKNEVVSLNAKVDALLSAMDALVIARPA